jgi:predicted ester cyclase
MSADKTKNKDLEANKAIVRRWIEEGLNQKQPEVIDELAGPGFILHWSPVPTPVDFPSYKQLITTGLTAIPDFHIEIHALIAEGDLVTARLTQSGTHQGEFAGVPGTGKPVIQPAIAIYRIEDGKIAEEWAAERSWTDSLRELAASS